MEPIRKNKAHEKQTHFSALIWDCHVEIPLDGAQIIIRAQDDSKAHTQTTDKSGTIKTHELLPGVYRWTIQCPGYLTEEFSARVPHSGHFTNCRIRMTPWRALALSAFQRRLKENGYHALMLGEKTPSELAAILIKKTALDASALKSLSTHFEKLYFSGDTELNKTTHEQFLSRLGSALDGQGQQEGGV